MTGKGEENGLVYDGACTAKRITASGSDGGRSMTASAAAAEDL